MLSFRQQTTNNYQRTLPNLYVCLVVFICSKTNAK